MMLGVQPLVAMATASAAMDETAAENFMDAFLDNVSMWQC
jgi:hypothetical protein